MKRITLLLSFVCLSVLIYVSCTDSFLNKTNQNSVNSSTFYKSEADAIASVNAAYSIMQTEGLWGRSIFFMLDFPSDEIGPTSNTQGPPLALLNHTYSSEGNVHINNVWSRFYILIAKTNLTIKNVSAMKDDQIDADIKSRVIGEAKFLRALGYFYINACFGGGPLYTTDNLDKQSLPRTSRDSTWTFIENDLKDAITSLPVSYDADNVGRATKGAAEALLGKTYLYQQKWADAATQLQKVIDSGAYNLIRASDFGGDPVAAMRSNFAAGDKNNAESIFEVQFKIGSGFGWGSNGTGLAESSVRPREYGVNGYAFYNAKPSDALINAYEDDDPRKKAFFFGPTSQYGDQPYKPIFDNVGYAWRKYENDGGQQLADNDINMDVIRYADVLLMYAEAQIQQGNVGDGIKYINKIRRRADPSGSILPDRPATSSKSQAMDYLVHERRVELCGEQVRFLDLIRWGLASDVLDTFNKGKNEVFPIPQGEIDANSELSSEDQNPGY